MLVLFDIDGTLLNTHGLGMRTIEQAGRLEFGDRFTVSGVEFAGRLDPLIFADALSASGVAPTPEHVLRLRRAYAERFREVVQSAASPLGRPCPGVRELLAALDGLDGLVLGVLTGNIAETGRLKLSHCGVDPDRFAVSVWGDEGEFPPGVVEPDREHLPPTGVRRFRERTGRALDASRVVIVGDTPHDIRCARAHGHRSIGVATGSTSVDVLRDAGADLALATLEDTGLILDWISGVGS